MFYNALIKFRDEQLENYHGHSLEYSASDYHHISRPAAATRAVARHSKNGRLQNQLRRRCQFSIVPEVSRRSSSAKEPKSSHSYDPFRASLSPPANPPVEYASVTIHRKSSDGRPIEEPTDGTETAEKPEACGMQPEEANDAPSPSMEVIKRTRKRKPEGSFNSRVSLAPSRRGFSPAPGVRAASSYKRNVSFRHIRNRSQTASSMKIKREQTRSQNSITKDLARDQSSSKLLSSTMLAPARYSSPTLPSPPAMVRTSEVVAATGKDLDVKKVRRNSSYWKEEARKVSNELSRICEEAFNRCSVSTGHTLESSIAGGTDSTATSISIHEEAERSKASAKSSERELPVHTEGLSCSDTVKELAETRRRLLEHSSKAGSEGLPEYLKEVIAHLDRLIAQDTARQQRCKSEEADQNRRAISDPIAKSAVDTHQLPSISEELTSPMESTGGSESKDSGHKALSQSSRVMSKREERSTIRVVPKDSSLPSIDEIKPLTIRKRNAQTSVTTGLRSSSADSASLYRNPSNSVEGQSNGTFFGSMRYNSRYRMALEPIEENPPCSQRSDARASFAEKKWSWFSKHKSQAYEETPPTAKDTVPAQQNSTNVSGPDVKTAEVSQSAAADETKTAARKSSGKSFLKIFGKKKTERSDSGSDKGNSSLSCVSTQLANFIQQPQETKLAKQTWLLRRTQTPMILRLRKTLCRLQNRSRSRNRNRRRDLDVGILVTPVRARTGLRGFSTSSPRPKSLPCRHPRRRRAKKSTRHYANGNNTAWKTCDSTRRRTSSMVVSRKRTVSSSLFLISTD